MATVANIALSVTARTQRLREGLARAQKRIVRFGKSVRKNVGKTLRRQMRQARKSVRNFTGGIIRAGKRIASFGAAAGAAAAGGLALFVGKEGQAIDRTRRVAQRLGSTTEALSALQGAALRAGVDTQTLNEGLQEMVQRLGEAKAGPSEAREAIKRLNLSAHRLVQMDPAAAFDRITRAVNRLPNPGDRAFAIDQLFGGSEGRELLDLISRGSAGVRRLTEQSRRMGFAIGEQAAGRIARANQAIRRMSVSVRGTARQLTTAFAPVVQVAAQRISQLSQRSGGLGRMLLRMARAGAMGLARIVDALQLVRGGFRKVQHAVLTGAATILRLVSALNKAVQKVRNWILSLDGARTVINAIAGAFKTVVGWVWSAIKAVGKLITMIPGLSEQLNNAFDVSNPVSRALDSAAKKLDQMAQKANQQGNAALSQFQRGGAQQAVGRFFRDVQRAMNQTSEMNRRQRRTLQLVNRQTRDQAKQAKKATGQWQKTKQAVDETAGSMKRVTRQASQMSPDAGRGFQTFDPGQVIAPGPKSALAAQAEARQRRGIGDSRGGAGPSPELAELKKIRRNTQRPPVTRS